MAGTDDALEPPPFSEALATPPTRGGHVLDDQLIRLELVRLLSLVLADRRMSDLIEKDRFRPGQPIVQLQSVAEDEITRLLVTTAIMLRAHDDSSGELPAVVCGRLLTRNGDGPETTSELPLREACNKILHATELRWRSVPGDEPEDGYIEPVLYLGGTRGNQRWRAAIDIAAYVCGAVSWLPW